MDFRLRSLTVENWWNKELQLYTGKIAEYLAGLSDSESVSRAWEDLRDVIVNAADAVLGRMERVKRKNWFDEECEQVNLKSRAYKRMQQNNYTRGAVEEYREARREENRMHKKKKGDDKQELIELESLRSSNAIRAYYQKLNESRKGFQLRTTLCRDNEGKILGSDEAIL
jgi:hypothetical protein